MVYVLSSILGYDSCVLELTLLFLLYTAAEWAGVQRESVVKQQQAIDSTTLRFTADVAKTVALTGMFVAFTGLNTRVDWSYLLNIATIALGFASKVTLTATWPA